VYTGFWWGNQRKITNWKIQTWMIAQYEKEYSCEIWGMDSVHLVHDRDSWRVLMKTVRNLKRSIK
jgi:hypothetical protein